MNAARLVIAGGGPVGLALAASCPGFQVDVLEAASGNPRASSDEFDIRVYALSAGTRTLLEAIDAWSGIAPGRVAPVRRMEIYGDGGGRLAFEPPLGEILAWIVEASRLGAALEEACAARPWVRVRHGATVVGFDSSAEGTNVRLETGESLAGDLLVGADGPDSKVRAALGIPCEERPYGETALVANFECEAPHAGVARQWFRPDGVLAWLPLPGSRISIVWSAPQTVADELGALESAAFAERVRDAGAAALGQLRLISRIGRFPLRLIRVPEPVAPGVALVGDAAHAVHPLAGQGVNLGFQDARCLAEVLAQRSPLERPGDVRLLRRYARGRREHVAAMQLVTDRLDQLFAARGPGMAALRNFGLRMVDSQRWAKRALAARAMR